jgi:hypothetical protein
LKYLYTCIEQQCRPFHTVAKLLQSCRESYVLVVFNRAANIFDKWEQFRYNKLIICEKSNVHKYVVSIAERDNGIFQLQNENCVIAASFIKEHKALNIRGTPLKQY